MPNPLMAAFQASKPKKPAPLEGGRQRVFPTKHPSVKNADGSHSNVVISGHSESKDGPIYAIPTMVEGKQLIDREAVGVAKKEGLHKYPRHKTGAEHNAWAGANHGNIEEDGFLRQERAKFPKLGKVRPVVQLPR